MPRRRARVVTNAYSAARRAPRRIVAVGSQKHIASMVCAACHAVAVD